MYFVNWQREVSIEEKDGIRTVVKRNKRTKEFHEYVLAATYTLISIFLGHPSRPPPFMPYDIHTNEGFETRKTLSKIGIPTPKLIMISSTTLIEEYIEGGDLYQALLNGKTHLAFKAGVLTGRLHMAGYVFTDNKAQNFLVGQDNQLLRTDLGFIQKATSPFAQSMDAGSFLASIMDLDNEIYPEVQESFLNGYKSETGSMFPYLTIIIRNILSLGLTSDYSQMTKNMFKDSRRTVGT